MEADPGYSSGPFDAVYQGTRGAFSEEAALLLLRSVAEPRLLGLRSLDDIGLALQRGLARYAVVPVRNSIAGEVPGTGAVVHLEGVRILAEISLPIVQCLVAPPGATVDTIQRVVSHPVALAQCRSFLDSHPRMRIEPHDDTAGALKMLVDSSATGAAAIASGRAADVWGGVVLQRGIQDRADNRTTFVLVGLPRLDKREAVEQRPSSIVGIPDDDIHGAFAGRGRDTDDRRLIHDGDGG